MRAPKSLDSSDSEVPGSRAVLAAVPVVVGVTGSIVVTGIRLGMLGLIEGRERHGRGGRVTPTRACVHVSCVEVKSGGPPAQKVRTCDF